MEAQAMSRYHDVLEFYGKLGWRKDEERGLVPDLALLQDQGKLALSVIHAGPKEKQPENVVRQVMNVSTAEIAEALRDLIIANNMVPSEHRTMLIGRSCIALQNAEWRIRSTT
jgi:hypothetical protein